MKSTASEPGLTMSYRLLNQSESLILSSLILVVGVSQSLSPASCVSIGLFLLFELFLTAGKYRGNIAFKRNQIQSTRFPAL